MNFKIYLEDKITSKHHKAAIAEYQKRLSRYCKITLIEGKSLDQILPLLSEKTYVIKMSSKGDQLTSEALSEKINTIGVSGYSDVSIIYTTDEFKADESLAVSNLDLSTGLFGVVMYEQIYRGYRILNGEPYHK